MDDCRIGSAGMRLGFNGAAPARARMVTYSETVLIGRLQRGRARAGADGSQPQYVQPACYCFNGAAPARARMAFSGHAQ